jgi:predicted secreted Zn-dependent protease
MKSFYKVLTFFLFFITISFHLSVLGQQQKRALSRTTVKKTFYKIKGKTINELILQIRKKNIQKALPHTISAASVQANLTINKIILPLPVRKKCFLKKQHLQWFLTIQYLLPLWEDKLHSSKELQKKWDSYYARLLIHENGHRDHFLQAALSIQKYLDNLPPGQAKGSKLNCLFFVSQVKNKIVNIFKKFEKKNLLYDNSTRHGLLQGAIL